MCSKNVKTVRNATPIDTDIQKNLTEAIKMKPVNSENNTKGGIEIPQQDKHVFSNI